jgi:GTP cyclohydrolase I
MKEVSKDATALVDIQNTADQRNIPIDKVGVRNVKYPIIVLDCANETQHTIGTFSLTVDLPHHFKGTHMSRFIEVLSEHSDMISVHAIPEILKGLKARLHAETAHLEVFFPFFVKKAAPVTKKTSMMEYECGFVASSNHVDDFEMVLRVPVTTLCPCSKEISAYGAHNQRGLVSVRIRFNEHLWLEEVIDMIESRASCSLFPLLKRPDEKWVTEHAYDNPRFVEDMVREVALAFDADSRITSYEIEVENYESIHAHNAYACLKRSK